jgi:hypothetical protein
MKHVRTMKSILFLLTLTALGCDQQEQISFYDSPKDPPPATAPAMPAMATADAANPSGAGDADPGAAGTLTWTVPQGWQQKPASEMRFATFQVNDNPPVQLTVIPLGGGPAGDVQANVNRWEGQLGLQPTPAEKIDSVVKKSTPNGLHVAAVDLRGEQQRMLAAIVPHGGRTWFFKMVGPGDIVEKQTAKWDTFLASLRPAAPALPAGAAPVAAAGSMKIANFKVPEDWKEIPGSKAPRMIAFTVGPDDKKAELVVTRFGQGKAGGILDNVNRWRGQIGLPSVENMQNVQMTDTTAGQAPAIMLEFDNPGGAGDATAKRMLVAMSVIGPDEWFFKLTGPPDAVDKQKAAFEGFLKSLEFAPEGDAK